MGSRVEMNGKLISYFYLIYILGYEYPLMGEDIRGSDVEEKKVTIWESKRKGESWRRDWPHFLKLNKLDPKQGYLPRSLYQQSDEVNPNRKI